MNIPLMDKRVRSLEEMMADLIATSENTSRIAAQTSVAMKEFGDRVDRSIEEGRADRRKSAEEMSKFQEEMQEDRRSFKAEMSEFREAMQADRKKSGEETHEFREAMQEDRRSFKAQMSEFKDKVDRTIEEGRSDRMNSREAMNKFQAEMEVGRKRSDESTNKFKEEMRLDRRELNKELGEIANKQGRLAEDLVAPSICRILRDTFRISALYECAANVRHKKIHPEDSGRMKEFDVIAICGDYVMVNETKSNPNASDIRKLRKTIRKFREYFPEHEDKKIVGSLGTLYAHKSLIRYASSKGILVLAVGDELMDVMNEPGFKPTEF